MNFKDKRRFFGKGKFERSTRGEEKKDYSFKSKKKFFKRKNSKTLGLTNNPRYFGKSLENSSLENERKKFNFKGKKKFKKRKNRTKKFTFRKHNKKRR